MCFFLPSRLALLGILARNTRLVSRTKHNRKPRKRPQPRVAETARAVYDVTIEAKAEGYTYVENLYANADRFLQRVPSLAYGVVSWDARRVHFVCWFEVSLRGRTQRQEIRARFPSAVFTRRHA